MGNLFLSIAGIIKEERERERERERENMSL
jgi:hypothetical protein